MSIKTSIYDFLAYVIPGGILMLLLLHGVESYTTWPCFSSLSGLQFSQWFLLALVFYIAGFVAEPVINQATAWYLPRKKAKVAAMEALKARNPALPVEINPADWAIWLATIRRESLELVYEIDRFNAQSKMLKGISFSALAAMFQLVCYMISGKLSWAFLALIPVLILIAFLTIRQAYKFKQWFYTIIYETVLSRNKPFSGAA